MKNMNKKGWIRIVEVFISTALILGIVSLIVTDRHISGENIENEILAKQTLILKNIQLNDTLRDEIVNYGGIIPISSEDVDFPEKTLEKINLELSSDLECYVKLCEIGDTCLAEEIQMESEKDVYARTIPIFANNALYSPKQVKLFCWKK